MTEDEVLDLFERIQIRWPNWKAPENLALGIEVYMDDLAEFSYDDVKAAYLTFKAQRFAPTLSEIVEVLAPTEIGEPWMARRAGDMGFFEKDRPVAKTLAELKANHAEAL